MILTRNGGDLTEDSEESTSSTTMRIYNANINDALQISASRKGLLSDENPRAEKRDRLSIIPGRLRLLKTNSSGNLVSSQARFQHFADEKDEVLRSVPSSTIQGFRKHFNWILAPRIDWKSLRMICTEWIKNPLNMALLLWIGCVAVSGAILCLVMTGMLNSVLPKRSQRNAWFEVNNQILNALFTLMCLYQHPRRFHHLVLLCRWKAKDITALRKIYCKNGTCKPREWTHMMVIVVLLHVNCFAQYALCTLNLGYKRSNRPALGVGICLSVAITAPAIAGVYSIISPLGREYDSGVDEEAQVQTLSNGASQPSHARVQALEKRISFASRNAKMIVEYAPKWSGGLFDIWDDISTAYLSLCCCFCVFGWNMERLGFGNMYVHIATFLLFCMAPFWIFNFAAINIDDETVREALALTGVVLCVFGLLYGGYWRIQMRKRFNLPANNLFGKPAVADCAQWLFCCWCSLAQEVRTADFYDIVEDKFCRKQKDENGQPSLSPLPREDGSVRFSSSPTLLWNNPRLSKLRAQNSSSPNRHPNYQHSAPDGEELLMLQELSAGGMDNSMKPPNFLSMQRED